MKPRALVILVGVLSAIVAGTGGYLLGRNSPGGLATGGPGAHGKHGAEESPAGGRAGSDWEKAEEAGAGEGGDGRAVETPAGEPSVDGRVAAGVSIRKILEQPGPMSRWQDMMDLAIQGDDAAVAAALEELGELPIGIDTIVGKFFFYSRYADGEPGAALESLSHLPEDELDLARASILGGWAGRAPGEAAAWLMQHADDRGNLESVNDRMLGSVVSEWARTNPEAALAWSLKLGEKSRRGAMDALLEQWAFNAPESAAKAMEGFPPGDERRDLFDKVANRWAQKDYKAALAWAQGLPESERGPAVGKAVENWAKDAPKAAAAFLAGMEEGAARDSAMRQTATSWGKQEPAAAADWVLQQPDNDARRKAMRDVMGIWVKEDSMAASAWLAEQPQGAPTDGAIAALADAVYEDDPEGAAIWATTMSNPIARAMQLKFISESWLKRDREAARAWIERADIDPNVKKELLGK